MTQITRDDVLALARLSSLELNENEIDSLITDIGAILGYVGQLGELDTEGVVPTYQLTNLQNVWRDDTIQTGVSREDLLKLSPDQANNQIKVPKVL